MLIDRSVKFWDQFWPWSNKCFEKGACAGFGSVNKSAGGIYEWKAGGGWVLMDSWAGLVVGGIVGQEGSAAGFSDFAPFAWCLAPSPSLWHPATQRMLHHSIFWPGHNIISTQSALRAWRVLTYLRISASFSGNSLGPRFSSVQFDSVWFDFCLGWFASLFIFSARGRRYCRLALEISVYFRYD